MHVFQPLNPLLYQRLVQRFGRVTVSHPGEAAQVFPEPTVWGTRFKFKGGEYYQICCPYCNDTRFRLYVSYLWGHYDPEYKTQHKDLVMCFNEECLRHSGNSDRLYHEVYGVMDEQLVRHAPVRQGVSVAGRVIGAPGRVISLADLPVSHSANQYLLSRSYDPVALARQYGLGYCEEAAPEYPVMWNRIVIPIYHNGQYVGFQGRALSDVKPKYYNPPGASKTEWLYNHDNAQHYSVLVITEGVTKVWRVGPFSVAIFGKTISPQQALMIAAMATKADFVILYLDWDTWFPEVNNRQTTITSAPRLVPAERAIQTLRLHVPEQKLIVVKLDPEQSPDEFTTEVNQQLLLGQLHHRGWRGDERDLLRRRATGESFRLPPRRRV